MDWDVDRATAEIDKALALAPSQSGATILAGTIAMSRGDFAAAGLLFRNATTVDPLSAQAFQQLGQNFAHTGMPALAEAALRKALALNPTASDLRTMLVRALLAQHRAAEALAQNRLEPDPLFRDTVQPAVLDALGRRSDADRALVAAETTYGNDAPNLIARISAGRNDVDNKLAWMECAYRTRAIDILFLKGDMAWTGVLADRRIKAFLKRTGLEK